MSDTRTRKHLHPSDFRARGTRDRDPRWRKAGTLKSVKQQRGNQRAALRKEYL